MSRIRLDPAFVQAVRDALDPVDLVSQYTELTERGGRWVGLCPFHQEKTPSFSIDAEQGLYYCFGCGAGGDAIKFHQELTGDDFAGTMEFLARRYGVPIPEASASDVPYDSGPSDALDAAAGFFTDQLRRSPEVLEYLKRRKIPQEAIETFEIGYAPDAWQGLLDAVGRRVKPKDMERAGLVARPRSGGDRLYDRFRHRLMFPIRSATGQLLGFGGRTLGDDRAKYINTAETERFQKSFILYGLHHARRHIRERGLVVLTEGYFDAIAVALCGYPNVVASMGTALTQQQVNLKARYPDAVIVAYDGDRAGEEAARKSLPLLLAAGLDVRRARFPAGQDPDSLRCDHGPETVADTLEGAEDLVEIELRSACAGARSPQEVARASQAVRELLSPIRDRVLRYAYGRRAADRLDVPVELLLEAEDPGRQRHRAPRQARQVKSLEERVLQLLLRGASPPEPLPAEELFFDEECRQIYRAILSCSEVFESIEDAGSKAVLERLEVGSGSVDRLAALLLEDATDFNEGELVESFNELTLRSKKQRLRTVARELAAAEEAGDMERLERLLVEKSELSRAVHGLSRG
ncbi:MAG: DNA primase [Acidobacteriota bacterium]